MITAPTSDDIPKILAGRSLLDVAAFLAVDTWNDEIRPNINRFMSPSTWPTGGDPAVELRHLEALVLETRGAARRYLGELFPAVSPEQLDQAWSRAEAFETAVSDAVAAFLGYPQEGSGPPPDPRVAFPDIAPDVQGHAWSRMMHALR